MQEQIRQSRKRYVTSRTLEEDSLARLCSLVLYVDDVLATNGVSVFREHEVRGPLITPGSLQHQIVFFDTGSTGA
jgi:hypothetical protein